MRRNGHVIGKAFSYIICFAVAALSLFPLLWMFLASFKTKTEVLATPLKLFPNKWISGNFETVINNPSNPLLNAMFMTFLVSAIAVVLSLLVNTMAAYVFARMELYGKKIIWAYCLITMYIPGVTILITSFLVIHNLGLYDTFFVLVLPGLAGGYAIFFFRQFFLNIPNSLEEAALIDGCGRFRIYINIFLPLSTTPLVVQGAGVFIGYWNSFLWPSITISNKNLQQIMPIIRSMQTDYGAEFGRIMAATCIAIIPPIVMFAIFQKYIVKGVVLSGLK